MWRCVVFFVTAAAQNDNIYWGSYDLTIPGGSGAGNAVELLSLPGNAPTLPNFQPNPVAQRVAGVNTSPTQYQSGPEQDFPRPQSSQSFRPPPQPQQFAPQTTQQFRPAVQPAPQPRQFVAQQPIISQENGGRRQQQQQQFNTDQLQVSGQRDTFTIQTVYGSSDFRAAESPVFTQSEPVSEHQNREEVISIEKEHYSQSVPVRQQSRPTTLSQPERSGPIGGSRDYVHDSSGDNELSRYQLYLLRKKQKQGQVVATPSNQQIATNEVIIQVTKKDDNCTF